MTQRYLEGYGKEFAIFNLPPKDASIKSFENEIYKPLSTPMERGPLEFNIPATSMQYIDLKETRLRLKLKVVNRDGTDLKDEDKVVLSNLALHALWSQVDFLIQQQNLTSTVGTNYSFKAFLDMLLFQSREKSRELEGQLYFGDSTSKTIRQISTAESSEIDLEGPLYIDLCQQNQFLLNGLDLKIKFWPNTESFYLQSDKEDADYKVKILDASLKLRLVNVNEGIIMGHGEVLKSNPAIYSYARTDIKTFNIAQGSYDFVMDNAFAGLIPSTVVVVLLKAKSYSGDYKTDAFAFESCNLNYIDFGISGALTTPQTPIYDKGMYTDSFLKLFQHGRNPDIHYSDYMTGKTVYIFDIQPSPSQFNRIIGKRGNTRLHLKFSKGLSEPMTVLV